MSKSKGNCLHTHRRLYQPIAVHLAGMYRLHQPSHRHLNPNSQTDYFLLTNQISQGNHLRLVDLLHHHSHRHLGQTIVADFLEMHLQGQQNRRRQYQGILLLVDLVSYLL